MGRHRCSAAGCTRGSWLLQPQAQVAGLDLAVHVAAWASTASTHGMAVGPADAQRWQEASVAGQRLSGAPGCAGATSGAALTRSVSPMLLLLLLLVLLHGLCMHVAAGRCSCACALMGQAKQA